MKNITIISILIILLCSCSTVDSQLDIALDMAGSNSVELQKVLKRYKDEDPEKYEAACFLISNMPFHGSYKGKDLKKYYKYFEEYSKLPFSKKVQELIDSLKKADGDFDISQLSYQKDITHIDSAFLTNHIDFAFKVWREKPWCKNVDFNSFCEYILPYRIGDEPLSCWREDIYNKYNPIVEKLSKDMDDPKVVAQILLDSLCTGKYHHTSLFPSGPHIGPDVLKWKSGSCREFTDAMIYVLRSLGIPCGVDRTILLGDNNASHFWNFIIDKNKETYYTNLPYDIIWRKAIKYNTTKAKVYRVTFGMNFKIYDELKGYENIHPNFRFPLFKDVTDIYIGDKNRNVSFDASQLLCSIKSNKLLYLSLTNRMGWEPVAYSVFKDGKITFKDVEGGAVYILSYWNGDKYETVTNPFFMDKETGKIRYITANRETERMTVYRKCHFPSSAWLDERMIGGVFEGSNNVEFNDADTLHSVTEVPYRLCTSVKLNATKPYRYLRYKGADGYYCNVAEIGFYENYNDSIQLCGEIIGPPSSLEDRGREYKYAFDGDVNTSFGYKNPDGGWTGMDFRRKTYVRKIVYTPQNDVNFIYKDNIYELFYWNDNNWESLGRQTGKSDSLLYTVPKNALYYLRNYTTGKDERIFEYIDGKQIFR
ncbi:transglutaminase-like domain-containing protein [Phocaeicola paurosaccharolyticus]|jgi:hypothetical protein|uniref:transglutaminase-like domain-containing protein n=2 Tax=Phocaeicola paurosaccharolyticus TaxID=732242 RepID=UPI002FE38859